MSCATNRGPAGCQHGTEPAGGPARAIAGRRDRTPAILALLWTVLLTLLGAGCTSSAPTSARPDPADMVDNGSWYVREPWPHDGKPVESEHFVVYSDGASQDARKRLASLAEEVLAEVEDVMGVDPVTMFRFPPGQTRIDLYASRYHEPEGGGARAYYAGVILPSFDHVGGREPTDVRSMRLTLTHELVHVVEALLKGRYVGDVPAGDPHRMPVWFSEGTAEALSGGVTPAPRSLDEMNALIRRFGRINPIAWQVDLPPSQLPPGAYPEYYYPMAHLAVDYLLDERGLGRSPRDLAAVMLDMGNGATFATAFETHTGISQADYQEQFFTRMDGYLPEHGSKLPAIALGALSLIAAGVMAGSLSWALRRRPVLASGGAAAPPAQTPLWFLVEVWAFAALGVAFTALLLFRIRFADLQPFTDRTPGYLTTGAYFLACGGALIYSARSSRRFLRRALLLAVLILAATGLAAVGIDRIFS